MNIWHDISASRITPEDFIACIEISKGGKNKYDLGWHGNGADCRPA